MQDKITIANAPDCLNTNDKAMWVLGYQAAIEARSPCLLQIQEPPTKTEALAHYSQQAILAMDEAAPAAMAVVLPEPAVVATRKHESPAKGSVEFTWGGNALKEEGEHKLFTEQQVRALLAGLSAPAGQANARDADGMYYLQDARWSAMVGNCPSWWRSDGNGYTTNLDEAARFTFADAMTQHRCRETDLPWLCSEMDKLRRTTVDCQYMPRSWDDQRAAIAAPVAAQGGRACLSE